MLSVGLRRGSVAGRPRSTAACPTWKEKSWKVGRLGAKEGAGLRGRGQVGTAAASPVQGKLPWARGPSPQVLERRGSGQAVGLPPQGPWTHSFGNIDGTPVCAGPRVTQNTEMDHTQSPALTGLSLFFRSVRGCSKPVALRARCRMAVTWDSVSLLHVAPTSSRLAWACSGRGWAGLPHRKQRCRAFGARAEKGSLLALLPPLVG